MNNQLTPATFRKFNNLLNSGAVTVTGPSQPRILKTRLVVQSGGGGGGGGGSVSSGAGGGVSSNVQQNVSDLDTTGGQGTRCYICDERCEPSTALTEMCTTHTSTKFPNKLAQLVGEGFLVIVCGEDYVCSRCTNLVNYYDRLENDVERVKTNLISLLNKKYAINEDVGLEAGPPMKMQKLTAGAGNRSIEDSPGGDLLRTRKVAQTTSGQLKTSSQPATTQAGSQQVQRKATKIYKCTSCDYKTSDMRLFNTHYESCKQQTFQCKTCRRIFPHFGAMKQHMVRDHNTAMDNTCAMCHINFVNDTSLRKHMETNHATNVLVTSTTTIPAAAAPVQAAANAAAAAAASNESSSLGGGSALYTCNHCQFKSTDKGIFDEHMRKHMTGAKPKPFKCRLCSQRFETRDAATIHAKQHQTNYFKCGTCAMTFPKRDLLVKHFEVHQNSGSTAAVSPKPNLNTQKLLQETIDEALSDTVPASGGGGAAAAAAAVVASAEAENNIRFFSCSICSLTFIQETYYNQHMETHRRDNKKAGSTAVGNTALNSAATALLSDEPSEATGKAAGEEAGVEHSEADIESLFEKLHSEKADSGEAAASKTSKSGEMVITSQAGSGGITFNITIPQPTDGEQNQKDSPDAPVSVSIDMPVLDQAEEESSQQSAKIAEVESEVANNEGKSQNAAAAPVSMPSLDDDNEASAAAVTDSESAKAGAGGGSKASNEKSAAPKSVDVKVESESTAKETVTQSAADEGIKVEATADSAVAGDVAESAETSQGEEVGGAAVEGEAAAAGGEQQVAMELDEAMQAQVDGGQIKFIVNENGHLLQLDNHILTDAEGNQIIVQDPEQIQQLLQSVGVLQSGEGLEGETLQMMTDGSGQMVLVHGDNNEQQLIDASLLNAEGQLIIQQGQDGEEGPHVISEDGTRIPVSVSYTEDGQPIVQVQQQVLEAAQAAQAEEKEAAAVAAAGEPTGQEEAQVSEASGAGTAATTTTAAATSAGGAVTTTTVAATSSSSGRASGGSFFALEEFTESKTD